MSIGEEKQIERLEGQLRFIQGSHDWLYREKQRLQDALDKIANCDPQATKEDLVAIAKRNLPTREEVAVRTAGDPLVK